jgi:hypothetical protein
LLAADSVKCVLGTKKIELTNSGKLTSPNEYYGLWAINGYTGSLKMRDYTNFNVKKGMENSFIWRYSFEYAQTIIGKVHHMTKI